MKKLLIVLLLSLFIAPLAKADQLFGFEDGAGLYNSEGVLLYTCFQDQTCVGLDNVIHTRAELGVGPVPITAAPTTSPTPSPTPQVVYVPVYTSPSNTPAPTPTPSIPVGGVPQATSVPISITPVISNFYMDNTGAFGFSSNEAVDLSKIQVVRSDGKYTLPFVFTGTSTQSSGLMVYSGKTDHNISEYLKYAHVDPNDQEAELWVNILIPDLSGNIATVGGLISRGPINPSLNIPVYVQFSLGSPANGFTY